MSKKLTIEAMRQLAESHGGKCLSDVYVDAFTKLTWQCSKGHQWTARPNNIQQGKRCPQCYEHRKGSIDGMRRLAETRGGRCLSDMYVGAGSKLLWECGKGHQWMATPSGVQRGQWCPRCSRDSRKLTIESMRQVAESHGGKCLSDTYVNNQSKLLWQCAKGHKWMARPNNVIHGTWCRRCSRDGRHLGLAMTLPMGVTPLCIQAEVGLV